MTTTSKNPSDKSQIYENLVVKDLGKSRTEVSASIPVEVWEKYRPDALKSLNDSITIDGFRKGMVPENILISKVGESMLLEEMAELAISKAYFEILLDNKIDAIGRPEVQLTKIAKGNPLEFKATTVVVPQLTLPDYKALAAKEVKKSSAKELEVTDKDVEEAILKFRRSRAVPKGEPSSAEGKDRKELSPEEKEKDLLASLPEFNDEFVRGLGEFKDVEDFKAKVRIMIGENKKDEAREKLRIRIADAITEATKAEIPEIMTRTELDRTQAQFETDLEKMGVKMDDYIKHAKKSLEEIRKEWEPHAEKKAKLQLILNAIASKENLRPDAKEIEDEVNHIVEHYKEADKERAAVYAETVLTNEKVFQMLEK